MTPISSKAHRRELKRYILTIVHTDKTRAALLSVFDSLITLGYPGDAARVFVALLAQDEMWEEVLADTQADE